jgi:hypothetical protein
VSIDIGFAFGCCAQRLTLPTRLVAQGFQVVGTANDFTYDTDPFSLDLADCVINPALSSLKELRVSEIGSTATTRTVRAVVSDTGGNTTIPDGALYSCTFAFPCSTLPRTYPVANSNREAFDIAGMTLATGGTDGALIASVNCFMPTPTPTPSD